MVQSGGLTPADQINARFAVRVKTAVYESVTTTLACLMTHIWLLLRKVQYTDVPLQPVRVQINATFQTISQAI